MGFHPNPHKKLSFLTSHPMGVLTFYLSNSGLVTVSAPNKGQGALSLAGSLRASSPHIFSPKKAKQGFALNYRSAVNAEGVNKRKQSLLLNRAIFAKAPPLHSAKGIAFGIRFGCRYGYLSRKRKDRKKTRDCGFCAPSPVFIIPLLVRPSSPITILHC